MNIIPLKTRLSSTRGLPWDLGKQGSRRAIRSSLSQKRSDMFTALFSCGESRGQAELNGSRPWEATSRLRRSPMGGISSSTTSPSARYRSCTSPQQSPALADHAGRLECMVHPLREARAGGVVLGSRDGEAVAFATDRLAAPDLVQPGATFP